MIFLGDLACPDCKVDDFNNSISAIEQFKDEIVILNLEAVFLNTGETAIGERLYNSLHALDQLSKTASKVIVSIANNHMYDYPDYILYTVRQLEDMGIGVIGLANESTDLTPYTFQDKNNNTIAIFAHCWDLYTTTNPNKKNDIRIVDSDYAEFAKQVIRYKKENQSHNVYCFMHWNYDLESIPFPMHIRFAHHLIDNGISGIIGSHSHVVQNVEIYKNCPIAYCLGNFYLPSGIYFDGNLKYPHQSTKTIGLRTDGTIHSVLEFQTDTDAPIKFVRECKFNDYDLNNLCPTSDIKRYKRYFKQNRRKRLLVPVFDSFDGIGYKINNKLAIYRVMAIKSLLKIKNRIK